MAWIFLSMAGVLEIGFAFGMKWSAGFTRLIPGVFTAITGLSSIFLLSISLRTLPVGTGYAVWTGIGAAEPRFWEWPCSVNPLHHSKCSVLLSSWQV